MVRLDDEQVASRRRRFDSFPRDQRRTSDDSPMPKDDGVEGDKLRIATLRGGLAVDEEVQRVSGGQHV